MQDLLKHNNRLACYLILEQDSKTLLLLRKNTGFEDGNYSLIAGKIESGESLLLSAVREAWEEAGIILKKEDVALVHVLHRRTSNQQTNWVDFFFKAKNGKEKWLIVSQKNVRSCNGLRKTIFHIIWWNM